MKIKYLIFLVIIIIILFIYIYKDNIFNTEDKIESNEILNSNGVAKIDNKKIILADILNFKNEILVTEDNIDNTDKIIENANLKSGVYIVEGSRAQFNEILIETFQNDYFIVDDNGYLVLNKEISLKNKGIENKILKQINKNDKTIIVKITDEYLNRIDGIMLNFMINPDCYVENYQCTEKMIVSLINPQKIGSDIDNNTKKDNYEEILINIFE